MLRWASAGSHTANRGQPTSRAGWITLWLAVGEGSSTGCSFSLYWALGDRWLLDTVGACAVKLADDAPVAAGLVLAPVAAVKFAGCRDPSARRGGSATRTPGWRIAEWIGAVGLSGYGLLNTVVAGSYWPA